MGMYFETAPAEELCDCVDALLTDAQAELIERSPQKEQRIVSVALKNPDNRVRRCDCAKCDGSGIKPAYQHGKRSPFIADGKEDNLDKLQVFAIKYDQIITATIYMLLVAVCMMTIFPTALIGAEVFSVVHAVVQNLYDVSSYQESHLYLSRHYDFEIFTREVAHWYYMTSMFVIAFVLTATNILKKSLIRKMTMKKSNLS